MVMNKILYEEGENVSHIVVMGTGEPFDNYDNVSSFIHIMNEAKGLAIGARHITVSTCGLVPGIKRYGDEGIQVNLAISLHAPNDKIKLDKGEQALLLINRRGYWTGIECPKCGHIFTCPNCGGNLTFHQEDSMLKCHHCGFVEKYPEHCPSCGNTRLRRVGYGTERVVKELQDLFPEARVARMDSDIGKVSKNVEKILHEFKDGKYDILVGTQMIAKGHDFPNVTLSAVVLADIGLSLPTYRASERTFQLIAQAVGRSGRSKRVGEAMIQTYNPDHYAIKNGASQDYGAFYLREMQQRRITEYPPYWNCILLEFSSSKRKVLQ